MCKIFADMKFFVKILLAAAVSAAALGCAPRDRYIAFSGFAQGGTYTVKLNLNGRDGMVKVSPETIRDSVEAILSAIDNSISGYNKKSLLSRFNAGETIVPDKIFVEIYNKAYEVYEATGGVVDVASAPLFDIWGFGFASGSMPSDAEVARVKASCGMGRLRERMVLREDGSLAAGDLLRGDGVVGCGFVGCGERASIDGSAGCGEGASGGWTAGDGLAGVEASGCEGAVEVVLPKLNYNAIAQGYSCDLVAEYLYSIGVCDMMVDIGEIFCAGHNPSGQAWTVGIDRPVDGNNELGADIQGIFRNPEGPHGIVTSGNYRKFYIRDGLKYAHTIDPRTGYPVQHNLLSATIVAHDALTADAYATHCMALGLEASQAFLATRPDLSACLIYDSPEGFRTWCSEGFVLETLE